MKRALAAGFGLLLAGCSYPHSTVSTVDTRPHLAIAGAPVGAQLTIDNVAMGAATDYTPDKRIITLDHGTHHVTVSNGGKIIYDNDIYLGDGADSTITIPQ